MHSAILDFANTLLTKYRPSLENPARCFIGFDGFTDEIVAPIAQIEDTLSGTRFPTMAAFTAWLASMSGKSCNVELELRTKKIGGNAPILANALIEGGHRITLAGCLGEQEIEPIFLPLTSRCEELFTLAASGHSDALEFNDGKIILGKLSHITRLSASAVIEKIGKEKLLQIIDRSQLFISANWTMLPMMNELWSYISQEIVPHLSPAPRVLFVDLADPSKRTDSDLQKAILLLQKLNSSFYVIQGLNLAEAERFAKIFGIQTGEMETLAIELRQKLGFRQLLIHHPQSACVATLEGVETVKTAYTAAPFLTTGAGDNFNAGFCNALLLGLPPLQTLISAVSTASYYVRQGKSPTMEELAFFCSAWDKHAV